MPDTSSQLKSKEYEPSSDRRLSLRNTLANPFNKFDTRRMTEVWWPMLSGQ